ncbi:MAG: pyrroline-5-carboxylate reductase [Natronospirillum sp.]
MTAMTEPNATQVTFIGTGSMAGAIIGGMLKHGFSAHQIAGTTRSESSAQAASEAYGIAVTTDNIAAVMAADVVVLAVKPQMMSATCHALRDAVQARQPLVISVAAGLSAETLNQWLGGGLAVVRCMPNTPSMLGAGVSGLFANDAVTTEQQTLTTQLFDSVGLTHWVTDENDMHLVTALCGSAPAYYYRFTEALMQAAVQRGMAQPDAQRLASQVALGAARMMTETEHTPATLRQQVSSPGGTTVQALGIFDQQGLDSLVADAVAACVERSESLAVELASQAD